jgi:hypothetical protein
VPEPPQRMTGVTREGLTLLLINWAKGTDMVFINKEALFYLNNQEC